MGDIAKHFNRVEFACRCGCGFDTVDAELLKVLETLRDAVNQSVHITSGCRCLKYNRRVGSRDTSQHTLGRAADIQILGLRPSDIFARLNEAYPGQYGLGLYNTFVHIDTKTGGPRRW